MCLHLHAIWEKDKIVILGEMIKSMSSLDRLLWFKYKYIDLWNRKEISEINPNINGPLIFDNSVISIQWGE